MGKHVCGNCQLYGHCNTRTGKPKETEIACLLLQQNFIDRGFESPKVPDIPNRAPRRRIIDRQADVIILECGHCVLASPEEEERYCYQCPHKDGTPKWSWIPMEEELKERDREFLYLIGQEEKGLLDKAGRVRIEWMQKEVREHVNIEPAEPK